MIQAAKEFPNVQFCHSTGTKAHTEGLANYHNAFASIYEGRYLAGVAAGMKLNEMIENGKITADAGQDRLCRRLHLRRGYLRLHLLLPGRPLRLPHRHHGSDLHRLLVRRDRREGRRSEADQQRLQVLISQHADSMGAPTACETAGVPNVSYNGSTAVRLPQHLHRFLPHRLGSLL